MKEIIKLDYLKNNLLPVFCRYREFCFIISSQKSLKQLT